MASLALTTCPYSTIASGMTNKITGSKKMACDMLYDFMPLLQSWILCWRWRPFGATIQDCFELNVDHPFTGSASYIALLWINCRLDMAVVLVLQTSLHSPYLPTFECPRATALQLCIDLVLLGRGQLKVSLRNSITVTLRTQVQHYLLQTNFKSKRLQILTWLSQYLSM